MIIQIESSNPKLSYILSKNPSSGLFIKPIRAGFALGKFVDAGYVLAYEEAHNKDSFDKQDNGIPYRKFCDPVAALALLRTLSCLTIDSYKEYEDESTVNLIFIPCIDLNNIEPKIFNCEGFTASSNAIGDSNLSALLIYSTWGLVDTLRYLGVMLFLCTMRQDYYYTWDQGVLYANIISSITKIPFLIRHKFRSMLHERYTAQAVALLNNETIQLSALGKTTVQRRAFVKDNLECSCVLDIGCGTGQYMTLCKDGLYIGVDVDEKSLRKAEFKAQDRRIEARFYNDYKEALDSLVEPTSVLLIEVIEHIEYESMVKMLNDIRSNPNVKQLIVSTPNKDFNQYLSLDSESTRHEDHLFELTEEQFKVVIGEPVKFGDEYEGKCMTLYFKESINHE